MAPEEGEEEEEEEERGRVRRRFRRRFQRRACHAPRVIALVKHAEAQLKRLALVESLAVQARFVHEVVLPTLDGFTSKLRRRLGAHGGGAPSREPGNWEGAGAIVHILAYAAPRLADWQEAPPLAALAMERQAADADEKAEEAEVAAGEEEGERGDEEAGDDDDDHADTAPRSAAKALAGLTRSGAAGLAKVGLSTGAELVSSGATMASSAAGTLSSATLARATQVGGGQRCNCRARRSRFARRALWHGGPRREGRRAAAGAPATRRWRGRARRRHC